METMAADVIALMDSLGIKTAVIAGHSMGGYVTLALLKYYPERLIAVGMVASQAAADSPEKYLARMESIEEIKVSGPAAVTEGMLARLTRKEDILPELAGIISAATSPGFDRHLVCYRQTRRCPCMAAQHKNPFDGDQWC